eukprot:4127546-Amphidinium_carterae.1
MPVEEARVCDVGMLQLFTLKLESATCFRSCMYRESLGNSRSELQPKPPTSEVHHGMPDSDACTPVIGPARDSHPHKLS